MSLEWVLGSLGPAWRAPLLVQRGKMRQQPAQQHLRSVRWVEHPTTLQIGLSGSVPEHECFFTNLPLRWWYPLMGCFLVLSDFFFSLSNDMQENQCDLFPWCLPPVSQQAISHLKLLPTLTEMQCLPLGPLVHSSRGFRPSIHLPHRHFVLCNYSSLFS